MVAGGVELCFVEPGDGRLADEVALRYRVLREPLGLPEAAVRFDFEAESQHLLALEGERVIGCVLFHPRGQGGRLYQMAVDPRSQRRGIGRRLVRRLEETLPPRGIARVELHARQSAVGFYERLGYRCEGEPFLEIGLIHRKMTRQLPPGPGTPALR